MTPGAPPPSTPEPRKFLLSRRPPAASQQDTPGLRQFQAPPPSSSSSQRFRTTPRFAPPPPSTPRPPPSSTQTFSVPARSTQRSFQDPIHDDGLDSSPSGGGASLPRISAAVNVNDSIEVDSTEPESELTSSFIGDSEIGSEGPTPKRRRLADLTDSSPGDWYSAPDDVETLRRKKSLGIEDVLGSPGGSDRNAVDEILIRSPETEDDDRLSSTSSQPQDDEVGDADAIDTAAEAIDANQQHQQPTFRQAPRFKISETEANHREGLPEAFSPRRRGAKYVPGGLAAETQSWLTEVRGWGGHDGFGDAALRIAVDEVRQGNKMRLVRGRQLGLADNTAGDGVEPLRVILAGEGKAMGIARRPSLSLGSIVTVLQPTWDVELDEEGKWMVACNWTVTS